MEKMIKLLAVSILSFLSLMSFAYADEQSDMTVTKTVASCFAVEIPKTIDLGQSITKEFTITASGNIDSYETLVVTAYNAKMSRAGDDVYSKYAQVSLVDAKWKGDQLSIDGSSKQGSVTFNETSAGQYTGTALFEVFLYDGPVID